MLILGRRNEKSNGNESNERQSRSHKGSISPERRQRKENVHNQARTHQLNQLKN